VGGGAAQPAKAAAVKKGSGAGPTAKARPADNRRVTLAQQRRRNQTFLAAGVIGLVVIVIVVFVIIKLTGGTTKSDTTTSAVDNTTLTSFTTGVSLQAMKAAADNYNLTQVGGVYPTVISGAPITTGKPTLLYLGAEYCPYCATERWAMVLALSKFGTFRGLHSIHSSATDQFPNTATFSFYKSTYTSKYLTFTPVEEQTVTHATLQTATAAEDKIQAKYDPEGYIPFLYFNGKAEFNGAEYNAGLLAGKSFDQVAASIDGGTSKLASSAIADAGVLVSMLCRMTGGKPGNVCSLFPKPITS
jgi:hypothetical protein